MEMRIWADFGASKSALRLTQIPKTSPSALNSDSRSTTSYELIDLILDCSAFSR